QILLVKTGTGFLQTIAFILVIASIVQFVEMVIQKMSPSLYQACLQTFLATKKKLTIKRIRLILQSIFVIESKQHRGVTGLPYKYY
ncbi:Rnf-Nqr domain containing protein, partial [Clostridioides difficile]|uniref:Rnf-Nqr domain containing protein n=1 Tax=Clostridioides difficile TaxID=1496 RepID=UPI003F8D44C7